MATNEYIEYCEDEVKMEIKSEDDDMELSPNRKYSEYFEVKEEIVNEKNPQSKLVNHVCDICSKSYKSKGNLTQHIQSVHKGLKFPCDQCVYQATTKENLWAHLRSVHEKIKYPCDQCQHSATTKGDLKSHARSVHEGIKYPCSQCDKQFTKQANLKTHNESVHKLSLIHI